MGEPDLVDPRPVTHIAELAARPRVCLQVRVPVAGGACMHRWAFGCVFMLSACDSYCVSITTFDGCMRLVNPTFLMPCHPVAPIHRSMGSCLAT